MELMKSIFISLGVLVVVGLGGYFGYNAAYAMGETAGYDIGYPAGEEAGYSSGKQDGYEEGYISGEKDGYAEGETAGYISGKQDGYDEGKADGYARGEAIGYFSGKQDGYKEGEAEGYVHGEIVGYEQGYDAGVEAGLGHGYTLKDPTYAETVAFLAEDKTDENEYNEDSYVCSHFSRDVCNNAETEGLRCAIVVLRHPTDGSGGNHVIIAFNTIDKGMVYFEPQFDDRVQITLGKSYSEINGYQQAFLYDDTINEVLVIW